MKERQEIRRDLSRKDAEGSIKGDPANPMLTGKLLSFVAESLIQWLCALKTTIRKQLIPIIYNNS